MFSKNIFSERLKILRIEKGIILENFGAVFGVSKQSAQRWETGINMPTAENIADYFDISTDYLLGRSDDPTRH